jgi:carbon-monoxide dehydrogenase iron sulfur subunit
MAKKPKQAAGDDRVLICRIERCMACKSCEVACAVAHSKSKDLLGALREEPRPQRRLTVEAVGTQAVPIQCRHCEDAPCMAACPTGAISRTGERGPVLIAEDRCIGCKMCIVACPFGVIDLARDGKAVVKCDLCRDRLAAGEEPACVAACPTGAILLVSVEENNRRKRRAAAQQARTEAAAGEPAAKA